jgi:hypothetical protein
VERQPPHPATKHPDLETARAHTNQSSERRLWERVGTHSACCSPTIELACSTRSIEESSRNAVGGRLEITEGVEGGAALTIKRMSGVGRGLHRGARSKRRNDAFKSGRSPPPSMGGEQNGFWEGQIDGQSAQNRTLLQNKLMLIFINLLAALNLKDHLDLPR